VALVRTRRPFVSDMADVSIRASGPSTSASVAEKSRRSEATALVREWRAKQQAV